jgi:hypothetical protein
MLAVTSLCLATNAIHALLKNYVAYGLAFTGLTITSLLYHTGSKDYTTPYVKIVFWLDQAFIYSIFVIGFYYVLQIQLMNQLAAVLSIGLCMLYYHYGKLTNQFCWDKEIGSLYHGCMHVAGALGHHAIMMGL